jgi:hypothetical protein
VFPVAIRDCLLQVAQRHVSCRDPAAFAVVSGFDGANLTPHRLQSEQDLAGGVSPVAFDTNLLPASSPSSRKLTIQQYPIHHI